MKKLNVIGEKLVSKIKEKFSIEKIMKENKLQSVFKKITILAVIIFAVFTIIIYETLNISYNNQNKIYEDRYSASMYANKINENILNIKISLIIYNSNHNKDISESLSLSGKDIDYNIKKYKMLRNISDEEKKIIDKFIELNTIYSSKIKKISNDIEESKIVSENEIKEIISAGDKRIELSDNLINSANDRINMLNKENRKTKKAVLHTIVIINFAMISLFILMIFVVKKISQRAEYYVLYNSVTGLPNKNHVMNAIAKDIKERYKDKFALLISLEDRKSVV